VALDERDSLRTFDADSLVKNAGVGGRDSFTPFALPDLEGDTVRLQEDAGKSSPTWRPSMASSPGVTSRLPPSRTTWIPPRCEPSSRPFIPRFRSSSAVAG